MDSVVKTVVMLIFMAAIIGYTVFNYMTGKLSGENFFLYMLVMLIPLIGMANSMIQKWKNRK